ncbi:MAG TPA: hypothetical protein PLO78_03045 [Candidatus Omnitrophota bacterium]|nr:hypothetical protein [Candidatus Omnitrophota bacterium]
MKKICACSLAFLMIFATMTPSVFAEGMKEFGASLLLPTTGQAMNGQIGSTKTKIMAGIEVAAVTTTILLATLTTGGIFWAGLGPLIANHAWSAADAFKTARSNKNDPYIQQQLSSAQRTLDMSRQNRFDRESDIRQRILKAGEQS